MKRRKGRIYLLSRTFSFLGVGLVLTSLVASLIGIVPASAAAGSIWTTRGDCIDPQDANQYAFNEWVQLNGANFDPGQEVDWTIEGQPGGASCDPGAIVAYGTVTADSTGAFCFPAYQVNPDDCGTYSVTATGTKGDNYRVVDAENMAQIGDWVWGDLNGDGIQNDGATGIAGVTVDLYRKQGGTFDYFASTVTNGSGYYEFWVLPAQYYVHFVLPADYIFSPQDQGGNDALDSDPNTSTGNTASFNAQKGNSYMTWDAGLISTLVHGEISVTKTADPTSIPETGGDVLYSLTVSNIGTVAVTIDTLMDDQFGDVTLMPGDCSVPQALAPAGDPGDEYSCSFTAHLSGGIPGQSHVNVLTASGYDEGQYPVSAYDDASVLFTDVGPQIEVIKNVSPGSVPESGGAVTFEVIVANLVSEELTLDSLTDDVYGDLNGMGTCSVPQTLAPAGDPGSSYSCTFPDTLAGEPSAPHTDTVTAWASDNDGNNVSDSDPATVNFTDILPEIMVVKDADPVVVPETGGNVSYSVTVYNMVNEALTLTSLTDDIYGDLDGQGDCSVPQALPIGGSYSCSFSAWVSGPAGASLTDWVTAWASDNDGNSIDATDDATVTMSDVVPSIVVDKTATPALIPETGANVTFDVEVTNNGDVSVELTSLTDDVFGNLTTIPGSTCVLPQTLAPLANYSCSFTQWLTGEPGAPHVDTVTAMAYDAQQNLAQDQDDAIVNFSDVLPQISVDKTADPTSVLETGGIVTFTVRVTNLVAEELELTSLLDDMFGDLTVIPGSTCSLPQILAPTGELGDYYECTFDADLSGEPGYPHIDTVSAIAQDNDGNSDEESDDAMVEFTNVPPVIDVDKFAIPSSVPESGANVDFYVDIYNLSDEEVTLTDLMDDQFGDLDGQGTCALPQILAPMGYAGDSYSCMFTVFMSGEPSAPHTDVVTGTAWDNDGYSAEDFDDATVTFTDIIPNITVDKTADPTVVPETGANVTYSVIVYNMVDEELTLDSLTDDIYGDLDGQGTCAVPQTLAPMGDPGDSYSCSFDQLVSGPAGADVIDWVTASASDNDGNTDDAMDDATVAIRDVLPNIMVEKTADPTLVPETGDDVTFTFVITNTGTVDITVTSLIDDIFGDLDGQGDCVLPQALAPLAQYECSITAFIAGAVATPHEDVVTATGEDADQNEVQDEDNAVVEFSDVLPEIAITKTPSRPTVVDPGGDVTFTVEVTNISPVEVTLDSLIDNLYGDLNGKGTCAVPQILAPAGEAGDSYACEFTEAILKEAGLIHRNTVTATGSDEEDNIVEASARAVVRVLTGDIPIIPVTGIDRLGWMIRLQQMLFNSGLLFLGLGMVLSGYRRLREKRS
jgi:uncharacterized repeat protein (TIGR01451 family)